MTQYKVSRTIAAPADLVFQTVAHIENFQDAVPHITKVEFLSESHVGVGTRFRETRLMKGREATTELEVTEYLLNHRVRLVSDAGGTIWDTLFTVEEESGSTTLAMVMDASPYRMISKMTLPMLGPTLRKAFEADMAAVKDYCEGSL